VQYQEGSAFKVSRGGCIRSPLAIRGTLVRSSGRAAAESFHIRIRTRTYVYTSTNMHRSFYIYISLLDPWIIATQLPPCFDSPPDDALVRHSTTGLYTPPFLPPTLVPSLALSPFFFCSPPAALPVFLYHRRIYLYVSMHHSVFCIYTCAGASFYKTSRIGTLLHPVSRVPWMWN